MAVSGTLWSPRGKQSRGSCIFTHGLLSPVSAVTCWADPSLADVLGSSQGRMGLAQEKEWHNCARGMY